jgi:hypothetical protein
MSEDRNEEEKQEPTPILDDAVATIADLRSYLDSALARLEAENAQLKSLLRKYGDHQHLGTTSEQIVVEEEIDKILRERSYENLNGMLEVDRENVLDLLCKKTEEGEISLRTEEGKQIWQNVLKFHADRYGEKEIDSIYPRLAECSRTEFQRHIHELIYDALFAVNGGANADFDAGYWAADKYAKYSLNRRIKKLREILQG